MFRIKASKNKLIAQNDHRQRNQSDHPLNLESISSFAEYVAYHEKMASEYADRTSRENQLIGDQQGFFTLAFASFVTKMWIFSAILRMLS